MWLRTFFLVKAGTAEPVLKWGLIIEATHYVEGSKSLSSQLKALQNAHARKSVGAEASVAPSPPRSLERRFVTNFLLNCKMEI